MLDAARVGYCAACLPSRHFHFILLSNPYPSLRSVRVSVLGQFHKCRQLLSFISIGTSLAITHTEIAWCVKLRASTFAAPDICRLRLGLVQIQRGHEQPDERRDRDAAACGFFFFIVRRGKSDAASAAVASSDDDDDRRRRPSGH